MIRKISSPFVRGGYAANPQDLSSILSMRGTGGPCLKLSECRYAIMRQEDEKLEFPERKKVLLGSRSFVDRLLFIPEAGENPLIFPEDLGETCYIKCDGNIWKIVLGVEVKKLRALGLSLDSLLGEDGWVGNNDGYMVHKDVRTPLDENLMLEAFKQKFGLKLSLLPIGVASTLVSEKVEQLRAKGIHFFTTITARSSDVLTEVIGVGKIDHMAFMETDFYASYYRGVVIGNMIGKGFIPALPRANKAQPISVAMKVEKIQHANFALSFDPEDIDALKEKAHALYSLGEYIDAFEVYIIIMKSGNEDVEVKTIFDNLLSIHLPPEISLGFYEQQAERFPDNVEIKKKVALYLQKAGKLKEALLQANIILNDIPEDWDMLDLKMKIFKELGDIQKVIELIDKMLAISPDHQYYFCKKIRMLFFDLKRQKEAVSLAKGWLKQYRKHTSVLNLVAVFLFNLGRYNESLGYVRYSFDLEDEDTETIDILVAIEEEMKELGIKINPIKPNFDLSLMEED